MKNTKQVIVITGATSGLGKETAKLLVANGHHVVILAPNERKVQSVSKAIGCDGVVADITNVESVRRAVEGVLKKHKKVDVLINNAGLWIEGELDQNDPAVIKQVIDVNVTGTIFMTQAVIATMKKKKRGLIINVISQAGLYTKPNRSSYTASKWALTGFTKCLQAELSPHGIRVSGVYPGVMSTPLFETAGFKRNLKDALDPKETAKAIAFAIESSPDVIFPEIGILRLADAR